MDGTVGGERVRFDGWWVVAGAFLIYFVSGGLFNTATVFFKAIAAELELGRGELSGAFSLGFFIAGLSAPLWGRIADRRGARAAFVPGVLLTGCLCMLLSRIHGVGSLYAGYVLFTFASAGISLVPVSVVISSWFVVRRGRAMGMAFMGEGFGALVLTPVAGLLVTWLGWRGAYLVVGAGVLVLLLPVVLKMTNRPQDVGQLPDGLPPGDNTGLPATGNDAVVIEAAERDGGDAGIVKSDRDTGAARGNEGTGSARTAGRAESGGVGQGVGIGRREALRMPVFWLVAVTWMIAMTPLAGVALHQVPFLTDLGLSVEQASLAAGMVGGLGVFGRVVFGVLSERYPIRLIYAVCYLFMAGGITALWLTPVWGLAALVCYVVLFGIAVGGAFALAALLVAHLFGVRALGEVFGLLGLAATIGGAVGGAGAGIMFDRLGNYDIVFAIAIAMSLLATVLMVQVKAPSVRVVGA